jgi:hypothetical protein
MPVCRRSGDIGVGPLGGVGAELGGPVFVEEQSTEIAYACDPLRCAVEESVAVTVNWYLPALAGAPVRRPSGDSDNQDGVPDDTEKP